MAGKYPRYISEKLELALSDNPVILIHGPRQCGKTTLAKKIGDARGYAYRSFDDSSYLEMALSDPMGFVADLPEKTVLDEVQRVPGIFAPLKAKIDEDRRPGRVIMTGSANVLLVPKLSDSLAGRMEVLNLHPLAQCEIEGCDPGFLGKLFGVGFKQEKYRRLGAELADRIATGGYPMALARPPKRRSDWYENYVHTLIQRDISDLARVNSLEILPKLLEAVAGQTASLFNVSELACPFELSRPTIRTYTNLLQAIFLLDILPPWHSNRLKRLIKTPKLHVTDSGLAAALSGLDPESMLSDRVRLGQLLETFAYQELKRQASWSASRIRFYHFRDKDGVEVDLVLEKGAGMVAGVEVKASSTVQSQDFKGLRKLKDAAGKKFAGGIVLYDGETSGRFEESLYAVPIAALWEGPRK